MAYNEFTFDVLAERFGIGIVERTDFFAYCPPVPVSDYLRTTLERHLPLTLGVDTEKVRSELLVMPLLVELRELLNRSIGVFSGAAFDVSPADGLQGFCDYLISRSAALLTVTAPVIAVVEAKRENLTGGIPQCIAEMYAAQRFNERRGHPLPVVFGVVTSGTAWRFLQLAGLTVTVAQPDYFIDDAEQILGILSCMAQQPA